ncbi:FIST signal transduction protein [Coraliomargarita parva]|uniref:FIST signal transduction protein n=1 Tax=Coraliomargarita parva TaxID=3014050 RepID=UPI0022B2FE3E|nr:FIST N-terminal domain-containing protein [Coraliomargarita parva]
MPVLDGYSAVEHFKLPYNTTQLEHWVEAQRSSFKAPVTFAMVFAAPEADASLADIMEVVRIYARVPVVVGASASGLVANSYEIESGCGFVVGLYALPETKAHAVHLPLSLFEGDDVAGALSTAVQDFSEQANAWMLFADPESMNSDAWLSDWDRATGGKVTVGGFASFQRAAGGTVLLCDGIVHEEGAVALALEGAVTIEPLVAQGCRPVGTPWTVTQVDHNIIHQIGNRPILEVLRDTLEGMTRREQKQARGNIFIGVVHNEYKSDFRTGDFLVRNLAAIDPKSGAVAIATPLRVGQNLQFQIRDPHAASVGFSMLLEGQAQLLAGRAVYGACLYNCIGRGASLFGVPDHDASVIRDVYEGLPVIGMFCNGEFGPVLGGQTRLHGYAASLGLFVARDSAAV